MHDAETIERIRQKYIALLPVMDERMRRQWAATEASMLGWGGVTVVAGGHRSGMEYDQGRDAGIGPPGGASRRAGR